MCRENAPETDTELVGKLLDQQNPSQSPSHLPSSCEPDLTRKRLKTLSKKLKQIEDLKEKQVKGIHLEANQVVIMRMILKSVCEMERRD